MKIKFLLFLLCVMTWQFSAAQNQTEIKFNDLMKSSKPYFVLKVGEQTIGIEKDDETFDINAINPEGIKEIFVFKDKEAVEKYGDNGSNGVVMIVFKDTYELPESIRKRFEKSK